MRKAAFHQSDSETWIKQWQSLVAPQNRNVPITVDGTTVEAFIQMNHFVVMLQDGLLMEQSFFSVCDHFQQAGFHVIWLMRCTQDVENGFLKRTAVLDGGKRGKWLWRKPTTNFGRWTTDNFNATILIQHTELPEGDLASCDDSVLARVTWAESDDPSKMIPDKTRFLTVAAPASPAALLRWIAGAPLYESPKA